MVNNFIFVEDGSLDTYNLRKLLEKSQMTEANIIRYKQGSPKPELISVNNSEIDIDTIRTEAGDERENHLMDSLFEFLDKKAIKHSVRDEFTFQTFYNMQINETPESFIKKFKEFLNNDKQ